MQVLSALLFGMFSHLTSFSSFLPLPFWLGIFAVFACLSLVEGDTQHNINFNPVGDEGTLHTL